MNHDKHENEFLNAYKENFHLRVKHLKIGLLLSLCLVPCFSVLDFVLYRESFLILSYCRYGLEALLIVILASLYTSLSKYLRTISVIAVLLMNTVFCLMIFLTEGMSSPYYAGISLAGLMAVVLLPYTVIDSLIVCGASLTIYVAACLLHANIYDWNIFINNLFFLASTSIICIIASYYQAKRRFELLQLNYDFDIKNKELAKLDQQKTNFFANISHELRTPLTMILSPVQDLLQSGKPLPDYIGEVLGYIRNNGLRLLKLVNDLLEITRLEYGNRDIERYPVNIIELIKNAVANMSYLAEMQQVELIDELPAENITVLGNHTALEKIFFNLLNNAIKFTSVNGSIRVKAKIESQKIRFTIIDTGIGIDAKDLPYIFDKFHQADGSATRKYQGTGLGLALVKDLVSIHDGEVNIESKVNQGTCVHVTFPLYTEISSDESPNRREHVPSDDKLSQLYLAAEQSGGLAVSLPQHIEMLDNQVSNKAAKLLIADDEPDIRRYLAGLLSNQWSVVQADNGESAWKIFKQHKPALAILDMMMPGMNGLDLCRKIKIDNEIQCTKVIILTAKVDEETKLQALSYGADDFITKPFSSIEIKTRLANLFENQQLHNELVSKNHSLSDALAKLKKTQAELIHSEKINSLGHMAAGLLHEINNPLNYTITALQLSKNDPAIQGDEDLKEAFADMEEGMQRIKTIVTDLRAFAYPSEADKHNSFNLYDAVRNAVTFSANDMKDCQVNLDIPTHIKVVASQTHIVQVLINLLTNAAKAIKKTDRQGMVRIHACKEGPRIVVTVEDNGIGMNEKIMSNIFNPFFTTAEVGQGHGLGLSVSDTIIANHGGKLKVASQENLGSKFSFDLAADA